MIKKKTAAKKKSTKPSAKKSAKPNKATAKKTVIKKKQPVLLSGGNPQIAKGDGDGPVQEYISALPGWKKDIGRKLDEIITRTVPYVYKAVKWNSPLYGIKGDGWFLGIHVFNKYVKVAFFKGSYLQPLPPGESKQKEVRYLDIKEKDQIDETQLSSWIKQAIKLPGEKM
ncbi:DUF1801 domain-containing protein [Leptospira licerasiae]|uniref:PF08818 domain protein n=1 Tax=Leptospira licerasiae str. MMD4847 TaxID=1049971 RepID=A0ABN0H419_9LEPT|nr:DUF1801 domain-containing protein [Leptospira licerasiae]EIE00530.1 hypothetical protein LEP1GSC185_0177 [Leptospira licerasiae serovar Varillal str. VAR 010]EJZ40158.1 PF08818 domain protein [Leptospira licerasiae str. MMD4847]